MILVLANGSSYLMEDYGHLGNMVHIAENETAARALVESITPANISHVEIYNDEGTPESLLASYDDLVKAFPPIRQAETDETGAETGRVLVTIGLREQTDVERRVSALEASQGIQDAAIDDLGMAVSDLAEG